MGAAPSSAQLATAFRVLVDMLCSLSPQQGTDDSPGRADVDLFCYCLINCATLADVIERAIRFTHISNNRWGGLRMETAGGLAVFSTDSRRSRNAAAPCLLDVFGLAFFFKLFSWLIAEPLPLHSVHLVHDGVPGEQVIDALFDGPLMFGARETALVFDSVFLSRPVVRTYNALSRVLAHLPLALLQLPRNGSTRAQVEMMFGRAIEACQAAPGLEQIADMLGQSISTLRRNLLREGTSFQQIADRLRMQRALQLLRETTLTLDEIAAALGFSGPSVFSRAFKGWTGQAPSAYRRLAGE